MPRMLKLRKRLAHPLGVRTATAGLMLVRPMREIVKKALDFLDGPIEPPDQHVARMADAPAHQIRAMVVVLLKKRALVAQWALFKDARRLCSYTRPHRLSHIGVPDTVTSFCDITGSPIMRPCSFPSVNDAICYAAAFDLLDFLERGHRRSSCIGTPVISWSTHAWS